MAGPRYPNQQLRSVSLETFFRGQFSVIAGWPRIQELVDAQLPNLFVPRTDGDALGDAAALRPYQLRNQAGTRSLALALNQASYIAFDYPGFSDFADEAVTILSRCYDSLGVGDLTRVVYRYENAIPMPRSEDGSLPIGALIQVSFPDWLGTADFTNLDLNWQRLWTHGRTFGHLFQESEPDGQVVLRISIASSVQPAGPVADLMRYAKLAHDEAVQTFDRMLTPSFRSWLEWKKPETEQ